MGCTCSRIPVYRTLCFSEFPIIRTKLNFPSTVKSYNLTPILRPPDNSNQFAFCKVVRKIGILLYFVCPKTESRVNSWVQERTLKTSYLSPSRACMSSLKITLLWKCRERWTLREHEILKRKMVYFSFNRTWVPRKSGRYFPVKEFLSNGQSINRMYTCVTTFSFVSFFSYLPRKNPTEHLIAEREQLYLFFTQLPS